MSNIFLVVVFSFVVYAKIMDLCYKADEKADTRRVQSFKSQLFLSSKMPNYGGFEPVEGWLVTLSDGSQAALRYSINIV